MTHVKYPSQRESLKMEFLEEFQIVFEGNLQRLIQVISIEISWEISDGIPRWSLQANSGRFFNNTLEKFYKKSK